MKGEMREANKRAAGAYQQSKKTSGANRKARKLIYHVSNMLTSKEANFGLFRLLQ